MFEMTFLEASVPLVKTYSLDSKGALVKESYPQTWEFTSHTTTITSLLDAHAAIVYRASLGHCLLKGNVSRPLVAESRAGSTDPNAATQFLCLDLDRTGEAASIEEILAALGLGACSYIVQYSASYGVEKEKGITAHVIILLSSPAAPASLKQWLIWHNLHTRLFTNELALTKTNNAISWPLDVTTCQNDKLIYIAPPILGEGIRVDFEHERIQIVQKGLPALDPNQLVIPSAEQNRIEAVTALDELRARKGLPTRKWSYRVEKGTGLEVLAKPDVSTLTGYKKERGFTYFNLNGGNSWGYYHPDESPEVIRNFKGEPNYLTSELLPEYWEQALQSKKKAQYAALSTKQTEGVSILAFRDFKSATYYNGTYEAGSNLLRIARAASERQLRDFLIEHGREPSDTIPIYALAYNPADLGARVVGNRVNLFEPSVYMEQAAADHATITGEDAADNGDSTSEPRSVSTGDESIRRKRSAANGNPQAALADLSRRCPTIVKLLRNSVGRDDGLCNHFLNWVACVFVHRGRTMVGWVLQGVEGTGKGQLVNRVLIPLLGRSNVAIRRMVEMEDQFNDYVERSLLVVVDEAQISSSRKSEMIMASLKHQITEPEVSVRKMFTASYLVPNYCNYLFNSNQPEPVVISPTDRRFNCGDYCTEKLNPTEEFLEQVDAELPEFAKFLAEFGADMKLARTIYESAARDLLKATSSNSIDSTAQALLEGNLEFFWDALPAGEVGYLSAENQAGHDAYTKLIHEALRTENGVQRLTRDEVRILFSYNVGDVARTPAKFTAMLRHHRVVLTPIRKDGRVVRGLEINWKASALWLRERLGELDERMPHLHLVKELRNAS